MKVAAFLVLSLLVSMEFIRVADAHGWMVDPVPQSGGGTGTANASGSSPCGKSGPNTIVATWAVGDNVTISYMNANNHGQSGYTVSLTLFAGTTPSAASVAANGILMGTGYMNTAVNTVQSKVVTVPNLPGSAVVQFHWAATDGSNWYDCAYVSVTANLTGPCAKNNGGCAPSASCTSPDDVTAVCACRAGFYGNGYSCAKMPNPVQIYMVTKTKFTQGNFTEMVAAAMGISSSRILYDTQTMNGDGSWQVSFYITSDNTGAQPKETAVSLRSQITVGDPAFTKAFGGDYIVSSQIVGTDTSPRTFGAAPTSAASSLGMNYLLLCAILALVFLLVN